MAKKDDLVKAVYELNKQQEIPVNSKETEKIVNNVIDSIVELTAEHGNLQLIGFGNFEVRERAARKGRNPKTGEELQIAASKSVGFKPGKTFKDFVK